MHMAVVIIIMLTFRELIYHNTIAGIFLAKNTLLIYSNVL